MSEKISPIYQKLLQKAQKATSPRPEQPISETPQRKIPLLEQMDLAEVFDGNGEPEIVLSKSFVSVSRVIVLHTWTPDTVNYDQFGNGGVGGTLGNGLNIYYGLPTEELPILPVAITATKDYMRLAYDTDVVVDTFGAAKKTYFASRFSFYTFMGNQDGLDMIGRRLLVKGPKDGDEAIADFGDVFVWTFEGWGWDR